jgi:hypothetical protein
MRKSHLLFAICLIFSFLVSSTVLLPKRVIASEMWQLTYGGTDDERAYSVIQTSDEGFALLGARYYIDLLTDDFYLIKTDEHGKLEWEKTYGGSDREGGRSLVQTSDGGYALAGSTTSFGAGNIDFWLVKIDSDGNMMWNQTYGGTETDSVTSMVQTSDGGYALLGRTNSFGAGIWVFWLVKTDPDGEMIWNQTYGGTQWDEPNSLIQTSDGGYALAGYTESFGEGGKDYWLIKADSEGNIVWSQTYGGTEADDATAMVKTSDGGYVLVGSSTSIALSGVWLVKTDADGNIVWSKRLIPAGSQLSDITSIVETSDGGYALTGDAPYHSIWVIKTDANGDILFYESYEAETGWHISSDCMIHASNDDYVLAGHISPVEGGIAPDVLLIKTPSSSIESSTYTNLIEANVYDESGLEEVTLSYMVDGGSWNNLTMTNTGGNLYSAEIEAYPKDTNVFWTIIAENNIGKSSQIENKIYIVIPEFPSWFLIPLSFSLTLGALIYKKRISHVYERLRTHS